MTDKEQIIYGTIPSKPNSMKVVTINGHGSLAKTKTLKEYEKSFYLQCGRYRDKMITDYFKIDVDAYLPTMAHDLDNIFKILLDCLQSCRAIKNDNRCIEIHARKFIDKKEPRVEFTITPVEI